jgi:hypothetical protein
MGEVYPGWFDGWQNARQRRAINELSGELSSLSSSLARQRSESSRLRSQLSQLHGSLEQRVNRLTTSLTALVELTDVQSVLAMFDPPALVRHRAREAITDLCEVRDRVPPFSPAADDVPGYWLGPAVATLVALADGTESELRAASLTIAEQRDSHRTALLLTCGLTLAGHAELAQRWLPVALGPLSPPVPVTEAKRTLWMMAAAGGFGAAGAATLRQRLAELFGGLTPDQQAAERKAWNELVDRLPASSVGVPALVRDDRTVQRSLAAAGTLTALRERCAPADPEPADVARDRLTAVLHALVDEGTPEEAPLLRRAAELRAVVEAAWEEAVPAAGWDAEVGYPCDLLRGDAFDEDRPGLAQTARLAARGWLIEVATRLVEETAATPPATVTVSVAGAGEVKVGPGGADSWDLSRARAEIEQRPVGDPRADRRVRGLAIAGGVLCLSVIGWPNPLAVIGVLLGLGLLVAAGVGWHGEREARAYQVGQKRVDLSALERSTGRAADELAELHRWLAGGADRAGADLAAIREHLPG